MIRLSIIICTHNPRSDQLRLVLDALKRQTLSIEQWELLLIDNASEEPLSKSWDLSWHPRAMHIREDERGLTVARLRGIKESTGEAVVFVDDDNVIEGNYLEVASQLLMSLPHVAIWGPGDVTVAWGINVAGWARQFGGLFQERHNQHVEYGRACDWMRFYPPGSGMVVRRKVLVEYSAAFRAGRVSACDRKGKTLSSGGDGQIVYCAIGMGFCAGVAPELRLVHAISCHRTTVRYMARLAFNVESDGRIVMVESFPDLREPMRRSLPSALRLNARFLMHLTKSLLFLRFRQGTVAGAALLGEYHGKFRAAGVEPPVLLKLAARALR